MIEIMSETEGNLLVVKATEKLTARDYEEVFIPKINQLIQAPFTQLHPQGIRGIFPTGEIEEILGFIQKIGA